MQSAVYTKKSEERTTLREADSAAEMLEVEQLPTPVGISSSGGCWWSA